MQKKLIYAYEHELEEITRQKKQEFPTEDKMKKYILDNVNSEIDFYIIHDNKGNTYEYHLDKKDVFVINRYEGDEGEIAKDNIAKEIRNFCNALER